MKRIVSNSATTGVRSAVLLLQLLLFVLAENATENNNRYDSSEIIPDDLETSLGPKDSSPVIEFPDFNLVHPHNRGFLRAVISQRIRASEYLTYDSSRLRVVSMCAEVPKVMNRGIAYWMLRDHRVQDNWALLYAQKLALEHRVPLHVVFCRPTVVLDDSYSYRQYRFMTAGLKKVLLELQSLNIQFHYLIGDSTEELPYFVRNYTIGGVVVDFSPLRDHLEKIRQLVLGVGFDVPVYQIDAHNVVPCWLCAHEQLPDPGAMRNIMSRKLNMYLTEFPPVIRHPHTAFQKSSPVDWNTAYTNLQMDRSVQTRTQFRAGYVAGMGTLYHFIRKKLLTYSSDRVNPIIDGLSNLSPWVHFGQISAQRILIEVLKLSNTHFMGVPAFREEMLVRRELMENYCYYNKKYDSIEGGPGWGQKTLNAHRNDTREFLYTREEFEDGQTRDFLWNAVHNQMKQEGKAHRFLRPFWAKKILEYSKTPEEAMATANYLNNKYSLDGNDPAGYGGIMWAMTGLHDKDCRERRITGKIRYVNSMAMRNRFNAEVYLRKYQRQIVLV